MRTDHYRADFRKLSLHIRPEKALQALLVSVLLATVVLGSTGLFAAGRRAPAFGWPLPDGDKRATPLAFDMYVTPDPGRNPIDPPERFTGYHVGQDFEIIPGEEDTDVPVLAVCAGPVIARKHADGYGGVVVQQCDLNGEPVTVLYGHISLQQTRQREGDSMRTGEQFAVLAPANSEESGFTRKHLHLSIHKGAGIEILGYLQERDRIGEFIDPVTVLGH